MPTEPPELPDEGFAPPIAEPEPVRPVDMVGGEEEALEELARWTTVPVKSRLVEMMLREEGLDRFVMRKRRTER